MSALAPILEAFFTDRLVQQRHASPHTIAAYRDAWRLLLRFAATDRATTPSKLKLGDLDAPLIARFLEHLEHDRANSARSRNARLSAIHALFRYAALEHPDQAATTVIALWLGHEHVDTTNIYIHADLAFEGTRAGENHPRWHPPRPLSTPGQAPGLSRRPLIMPMVSAQTPPATGVPVPTSA